MRASSCVAGLALVLSASTARGQAPPPGVAPDRQLVEVRVEPGDSCEAISARLYGDRRYYFVVAERLPGLTGVTRTACDQALSPGSILRLPRRAVAAGREPDARVTAVEREVQARPVRAESWRAARVGEELREGSRVRTLERSSAELTFEDSSRIHLRERTLVIVHGATTGEARRPSSRATLERGTLRSRLDELEGGSRLTVDSPAARAELEGGEAVVEVDSEATSRLSNHRGSPALVSAPDGRGRVKVHPGMGTRVRRGGLPSRPRPLPSAPEWTGEEGLLVVGLAGLGATVRAGWEPVESAAAYAVELVTESGAGAPTEVRHVPAGVRELEVRGLGPGSYAARVSTVDREGFESRPSRPLGVTVAELVPLPGLAAGASEGQVALLAGSRLHVPRGLRCRAGEGEVAPVLVLVEAGPVALRCQDSTGRQAPELVVEVVPVAARIAGLDEGEPLRLGEGERRASRVELAADVPLPDRVSPRAGPGLAVRLSSREDWALELEVTASSAEETAAGRGAAQEPRADAPAGAPRSAGRSRDEDERRHAGPDQSPSVAGAARSPAPLQGADQETRASRRSRGVDAPAGAALGEDERRHAGPDRSPSVAGAARSPEGVLETFLDLVVEGQGGEEALLARVPVVVEPAGEEGEAGEAADPDAGRAEAAGARRLWLSGPAAPAEVSALLLQRGSFGVRDEARPGSGAFLAFAWVGDRRDEAPSDRMVVSGGLRASFLDERLRLEVALHVAEDEQVGGGWVAVSSRVLRGRPFGLALELGAFVPFGGEGGEGSARVFPSVDGSIRIGDRVTLRTRQGALLDTGSPGARLWTSAYAVDLWAAGPLGAFAELLLAVGVDETGGLVAAPAASAGLSLRLHIVALAVGARYAFTDAGADLYGQVAVIGAVRLAAGL